jgi:hypothetical protein
MSVNARVYGRCLSSLLSFFLSSPFRGLMRTPERGRRDSEHSDVKARLQWIAQTTLDADKFRSV